MTFDGDVEVDPTVVVGLDAPGPAAPSRLDVLKIRGLVDEARYNRGLELLE